MNVKDKDMIDALATSPVFKGVAKKRIHEVINELGYSTCSFVGQDYICHAGDALAKYPILVRGTVEARLPKGNGFMIVGRFGAGDSFAEAVPTTLKVSPVDIVCLESSFVVYLPAASLEKTSDLDGLRVRANIMAAMAKKISELSYKLTLFAEPHLRNRLLMYLQSIDESGTGEVEIPFSRKDLASYLGANDKALSRELHRMQDEGLLIVRGRHVRLLVNKGQAKAIGEDK